MPKIINPWKKDAFYNVDEPVFQYGEYRIYKEFDKSYLYTYKNLAFNNLCGKSKEYLLAVANRDSAQNNQNLGRSALSAVFLYYRAVEVLEKHENTGRDSG